MAIAGLLENAELRWIMTKGQIWRWLLLAFVIFALAQWMKVIIQFTALELVAAILISLSFVALMLFRTSKAIWVVPAFMGGYCAVEGMEFVTHKVIAIPIWTAALCLLSSSAIGTFVSWRRSRRL